MNLIYVPLPDEIGISKTKQGRLDTDYLNPRELDSHWILFYITKRFGSWKLSQGFSPW